MILKKTKGKKRVVLIDTHAVLHRGYHALPDFTTRDGKHTGAVYGLATFLLSIIKELDPDFLIAAYDLPGDTFRHEQYEDYKATRGETDDALIEQFDRSRDLYNAMGVPMYDAPGFEADDILGTASKKLSERDDVEVVIASGDMDTLQLVDGKKVRVYTLKRSLSDTIVYDEAGVKTRFGFKPELLIDYKGLRGDPSDNIPGVPGVGEKTATTLITTFGDLDDIYKALEGDREKFIAKEGIKERTAKLLEEHKDEAFFSRDLATIRTDAPVDIDVNGDHWSDHVDIEAVDALFTELEFRSLRSRLKDAMEKYATTDLSEEEYALLMNQEEDMDIDESKLHEVQIMYWLLHSDRSNEEASEILHATKTDSLEEAKKKILEELKEKDILGVWEDVEKPLMPVVEEMEENGVLLDLGLLEELKKDYSKTLKKLEKKIWDLAGEEFNVNSPKQLGEILFEKLEVKGVRPKRTATGAYSTSASQLEKLKEDYEIAQEVLNYRELKKLLSTYIEPLAGMVDDDGRIHATFDQAGTTTGRFSSNDPNLQNIPTRSEHGMAVRKAFVAARGYELLALDYSQLELRTAAMLSQDPHMIAAFQEGDDFHAAVAAQVFEKKPGNVDKEERRRAKVINFGIVYGMGVNALKQNLGCTLAEAREFYEKYKERFSRLFEYFEEVKQFARNNGYTTTKFGRRRGAPDINSKAPFLRSQAERFAMNAPLQGTGADMVKLGMIRADKAIKKSGLGDDVKLILQVHDELVFEVKKDKLEEAAKIIKKEMEGVLSDSVKFLVDVSRGKNWGELKKFDI